MNEAETGTLRELIATLHGKLDDRMPSKAAVSGWVVAGVIISAIVGLGSLLTLLVMLMRIIPDVP